MTQSDYGTLIQACRICGENTFLEILDLGNQPLSGVFPKYTESDPPTGELILLFCESCTLVQLSRNFPLDDMYGENYGYRSRLNSSMQNHLERKISRLVRKFKIEKTQTIVDIGSNDGTMLNAIADEGFELVGIDPTIQKFSEYYDTRIYKIPDFFTRELLSTRFESAALITSISMLYDLPNPVKFALDVKESLARDGVWHFEQSYLPSMISSVSFDTICHEHLEYYSLSSIKALLDKASMRIIDIEFNSVNGGSFAITACRVESTHTAKPEVAFFIEREKALNSSGKSALENFKNSVAMSLSDLRNFFDFCETSKASVAGIGASTKGNVLLNALGLDAGNIFSIFDVNEDKKDCVTPGSRIPIIIENHTNKIEADFAFVLPWHFRSHMENRYSEYLSDGGKLVFPLPRFEIVAD